MLEPRNTEDATSNRVKRWLASTPGYNTLLLYYISYTLSLFQAIQVCK